MKTYIILFFLFAFSFKVQAQISNREDCNQINHETVKRCLVETFGQCWYNNFCRNEGKFFFVAEINIEGKTEKIEKYSLKRGISQKEFNLFKDSMEQNYYLCISNNNPELNDDEFIRIINTTEFFFTFLHQCKE